jgi:PHS family inorganic phosphate transporter-like MFS transporter
LFTLGIPKVCLFVTLTCDIAATRSEAWFMSELQAQGPGTDPPVHLLPQSGLASPGQTVSDLLNEAPTSKFHRRAVLISGMGFFTDAYDLFVIATVATLVKTQWNLSTTQVSWVTGSAILGAFFGAVIFGRIADVIGRKSIYVLVAVIMIIGAVASALAPGFWFLVIARFVLGLGIGGDYPVSAVLMSEYANRKDRGRLVGLVFSMQAVGLIVGPLVALVLLSSGIGDNLTWRLLLGLGALPAAGVVYLRSKMPESPRFKAKVKGEAREAAEQLQTFSEGTIHTGSTVAETTSQMRLGEFITNPRMLRLIIGTAGAWFLFDYAYYGNTLSLPSILKEVSPHASLEQKLAWSLGIFVVFALPGYLLAVMKMDRIGHRRLQFIGFAVMALCFLVLGIFPTLTTTVVPFLLIFGLSYFFVEFGPNTTTFVMPSEVFPVNMRTTGHGTAAGIGKLGAFIGVFLVPQLQLHFQLRGLLLVAGGAAILGFLLTGLLPEPALKSLEEISGEDEGDVVPFVRPHDSSEAAAGPTMGTVPVGAPVPSPSRTTEECSATIS